MARRTPSSSPSPTPKRRLTKKAATPHVTRKARILQAAKRTSQRLTTRLRAVTQRMVRTGSRTATPQAVASSETPGSRRRSPTPRATQASSTPTVPRRSRVRLKESAKRQPTSVSKRPRRQPSESVRSLLPQPARSAPAPTTSAPRATPAALHGIREEALAPRPQRGSLEASFTIPTGYGDHRIVLMVKDPWWLYAYWEIHPARERDVRSHLAPEEMGGLRSVLRVYDVSDRDFPNEPAHRWFDIPLSGLAMNWYIHVDAPHRSFVVDIGLLTKRGRFLLLARSNRVTTPRCGPSEIIDEEWMVTDEEYWKLVGITAGVGMGSSPGGLLREVLERKLTSPGLFSPSMLSAAKSAKAKAFGLSVNTELIVHGTTDPKATVTVQGEAVTLRTDGTFSVRMALPDGTQAIPVAAISPDKQATKTLTQTVIRTTEGRPAERRRRMRREEPLSGVMAE